MPHALTTGATLSPAIGVPNMAEPIIDTITPPAGVKTVTTTETIPSVANNGNGGLLGKYAQFGNLSAMGAVLVLFAFVTYYTTTSNSSALKEKIADDREERNYQRMKHDQDLSAERTTHEKDMTILTSGMTKNVENTASLIQELKTGREAIDKEAKARQEAFDKRTEQQHTQIKELHDIIIKKMNP